MGDQDKRLRTVHVRELTAQAYEDSCAEALDWILQISGKRWVTADDLGNFVRALAEILSNRLRSGGFDREPDWAGIVVLSR